MVRNLQTTAACTARLRDWFSMSSCIICSAATKNSSPHAIFTDDPLAEMKIKREHVAGSAEGETKPEVELITDDTVKRLENPGHVEVCKSSGKK